MKFRILKKEILAAVKQVKPFIAKKSYLPVLQHILFKVEGNSVQLSVTDLNNSIQKKVFCSVEAPGVFTLDAKDVFKILSTFPNGLVSFEKLPDKDKVEISCEGIKTTLPSFPENEIPFIWDHDGSKEGETVYFNQKIFKDCLEEVSFARLNDTSDTWKTGVSIRIRPEKTEFAATDGYRMAVYEDANTVSSTYLNLILSNSFVFLFEKNLSDKDQNDVIVKTDKENISFTIGNTRFVSRLISYDKYPRYEEIMPKENDNVATIPVKEFIEALTRANNIVTGAGVLLSFTEGSLALKARNSLGNEYNESIQIYYVGEEINVGFNPCFFLDVFKKSKHEKFLLHMKDNKTATLVSFFDNTNHFNIIMPLQIT